MKLFRRKYRRGWRRPNAVSDPGAFQETHLRAHRTFPPTRLLTPTPSGRIAFDFCRNWPPGRLNVQVKTQAA